MKVLYTAEATASGGREGRTRSSDGAVDVTLAVPKELGGPGEGGNPEQLFAAGYAACFHSALARIAEHKKLDATGSAVTAQVGLGFEEKGRFGLDVELHVDLPNVDREAAEALVEKAHEVCPYSNATRGNLEVRLVVERAGSAEKVA